MPPTKADSTVLRSNSTHPSRVSGTMKSTLALSTLVGALNASLITGSLYTYSLWILKPTPEPSISISNAQVKARGESTVTKAQFCRLASPCLLTKGVPNCQRNRPATVPLSPVRYARSLEDSASLNPQPSCSLEARMTRSTVSPHSSVRLSESPLVPSSARAYVLL